MGVPSESKETPMPICVKFPRILSLCPFFEFINQYRVNEVKAKITDPAYENLSLLGIAFESGFNTKSAFNRVFKKITGFTPGEYKKHQIE